MTLLNYSICIVDVIYCAVESLNKSPHSCTCVRVIVYLTTFVQRGGKSEFWWAYPKLYATEMNREIT